jgi:hypothetical protein
MLRASRPLFSGLSVGKTFNFYAVAYTRITGQTPNGTPKAARIAVTIKSITQPTPPQNFRGGWNMSSGIHHVSISGSQSNKLLWDSPANSGGDALLRYEVSWDGGINWLSVGLTKEWQINIGRPLQYGDKFAFYVRAVNIMGPSTPVSIFVFILPEPN